ncbi:hypothetical protein BGZ49_004241 [Haplosporangium sp. Z 27]|nr:hypothetical protein BGZ49_004241 [Haplosporangium sp. Z 27]
MFSDKGSSSVLRNRNLIAASVLTKSVSAATSNAPIVESASKFPPHHTLTSLSLTHVQFTQNDIVSKLLAYVTLTPLGIICGYVAVISTSRDLKPLVMLGGQLANEVLNLILKRIVKQARPTEYLGDGYGMPSSHSQFMAYFATYTVILMCRRGIEPGSIIPQAVCAAVTIWSSLVVYSRVHLYYHTWQQVLAGTICGIIFALIYYHIVNSVLRPLGLLEWIVDHPWAKQLHVRDTDAIPDLAKYDWEMWQQFRRSEHEKKE